MKYSARRPQTKWSLDGMSPRPAAAAIAAQPPPLLQQAVRSARPQTTKPVTIKPRRRIPHWLQLLILTPTILIVAFSIQSGAAGQLAIVVYGIAAFIWRIPSRTTFSLALISIITTTILFVVQGNFPLAQNFATYTFLFLVVGVFTLSRELKKEGGRIYNSRQHKQY